MKRFAAALATLFTTAGTLLACGPELEPEYFRNDTPYIVIVKPRVALKHFLASLKTPLPAGSEKIGKGISTSDADAADFKAALEKYYPDLPAKKADKLISDYRDYSFDCRVNPSPTPVNRPEMPDKLEEFLLYLDGVLEMYTTRKPMTAIPAAWAKLLKLPPERRHYRTVWVHFMLGSIFKDQLQTHYDNCRNAVRQGFADTAGLAWRSYTLEVRYATNYVNMLHRAIEAERIGIPVIDEILWKKLMRSDDATFFALTRDPLCREIISIFCNTPRFRKMVKGIKFSGADHCAYYAFKAKQYDIAEKFLASLPQKTLLSCWVEAKIARRKGKTDVAVKALQHWLKLAENVPELNQREILVLGFYKYGTAGFREEIYGLLGSVMIMRRDFMEAAVYMFKARQNNDMSRICERFFTIDELISFVNHPELKKLSNQKLYYKLYNNVRYVLARRAFRERKFDIAAKYMPELYQSKLRDFIKYSKESEKSSLSPDARAIAIYNAAKILRFSGMELAGTELEPDLTFTHGLYGTRKPCKDCSYDKWSGTWTLCKYCYSLFCDKKMAGFNSLPDHLTVHRRFHYRYQAAEMLLKAGRIAQDKELRALIYMLGRACLVRDQEADVFYKRLVLECRGTRIGELADHMRWFPKSPVLTRTIQSDEPLRDLAHVKAIMNKIFPTANTTVKENK